MKHFKSSLIAVVGVSFAGVAFAAGSPRVDATTVQDGLMAAAPIKLSVSEQFAKTGVWPDSNASADVEAAGDGQSVVSVSAGGVITIAYDAGVEIVLTPADGGNGRVNWRCSTKAMPDELVPSGCTPAAT